MRTLSDYERQILAALDHTGGFPTGYIAEHVYPMFGSTKRQHSAAVLSWLKQLEKDGLVRRMDDEKPIAWIKPTTHNAGGRHS